MVWHTAPRPPVRAAARRRAAVDRRPRPRHDLGVLLPLHCRRLAGRRGVQGLGDRPVQALGRVVARRHMVATGLRTLVITALRSERVRRRAGRRDEHSGLATPSLPRLAR
jgi:hypothetical protein